MTLCFLALFLKAAWSQVASIHRLRWVSDVCGVYGVRADFDTRVWLQHALDTVPQNVWGPLGWLPAAVQI